jgi:hypothetical protein
VTPETLRLVERAHALAAWAATVAIVLVALQLLRAGRCARGSRALGGLAVLLLVVGASSGMALHDPYRLRIRQRLFVHSTALGWLFERKQHAAFAAVLFGVCALASHLRLARQRGPEAEARLARTVALAWSAGAALAVAASIASTVVARHLSF